MGSSHRQQTIQGACVSETAVHDHGRQLNQREFRPKAEVPFRPARQLSEYKGKGASASRESEVKPTENIKRRKPQESTSYDLDMTSRMRRLSCNGSIQSTFKNPPF